MHFRRQRDALLTLQERKTRITLGGRLTSKQAEPAIDQIVAKLAALPKRARRSATFDNGGEWARRERLRDQLAMRTYFGDPRTPWQRGGIENANGVLRRDVPSHATLSTTTSTPCSGSSTPRPENASPSAPPWRPSLVNLVSRLKM